MGFPLFDSVLAALVEEASWDHYDYDFETKEEIDKNNIRRAAFRVHKRLLGSEDSFVADMYLLRLYKARKNIASIMKDTITLSPAALEQDVAFRNRMQASARARAAIRARLEKLDA